VLTLATRDTIPEPRDAAADQVDGPPVNPHSRAARGLIEWLDRFDGPLRSAEIGSPFDLATTPASPTKATNSTCISTTTARPRPAPCERPQQSARPGLTRQGARFRRRRG